MNVLDIIEGGYEVDREAFKKNYYNGVRACIGGYPEPEVIKPGFREGYAAQYAIEQSRTNQSMRGK